MNQPSHHQKRGYNKTDTPFGYFLSRIHNEAGDSGKDLSDKLGISPTYLCQFKAGNRNIPFTIVAQIIDMYNLSYQKIIKFLAFVSKNNTELLVYNFQQYKRREDLLLFLYKYNNVPDEKLDLIMNIIKD